MLGNERARQGLRERNKQDKLDRIQAAARALFEERGYDATTTREIAERAGIGTGTLFLYAKDKSELLFLIFQEDVEGGTRAAFETVPRGAPLIEQLLHVFRRVFAYYDQHPALTRAFVPEVFSILGRHRERMNVVTLGFLARLAALVEAGAARGELRADAPAQAAATSFFAVYYLSLAAWLSGNVPGPEAAVEGMLRPLLELQIRGLLPDVPRAAKKPRKGGSR